MMTKRQQEQLERTIRRNTIDVLLHLGDREARRRGAELRKALEEEERQGRSRKHTNRTKEVRSMNYVYCDGALRFDPQRGYVHATGGTYMQRCRACGHKAALYPSPRACPQCGSERDWGDDHCATPKRS
jgi:predicted SprT family Zn-dependent metalloprotease